MRWIELSTLSMTEAWCPDRIRLQVLNYMTVPNSEFRAVSADIISFLGIEAKSSPL